MAIVSVNEAKTHLSRLIEQVLAGEEVVVTRHKEPVIRLVPAAAVRKRAPLGAMKGRISVGEEAMESLPDDYLGLDIFDGVGD